MWKGIKNGDISSKMTAFPAHILFIALNSLGTYKAKWIGYLFTSPFECSLVTLQVAPFCLSTK